MYAKEPSLKTALLSAAKKLSFCGTTVPRYFRTSSGCSFTASPNEQKMMPSAASCSLNVVATETLSNTASTATPARILRTYEKLGVDLVERFRRGLLLRRGVIARGLVIDRRKFDLGPFRRRHLAPGAKGLQSPFEQPFRLALFCRDEAHRVLGEAGRRRVGFDIGDEPVFIALLGELADRLLRFERGAHRIKSERFRRRHGAAARRPAGTRT